MRKLQPVSKEKNARFGNVLELQKQSASLCANSQLIYIILFLVITVIAAAAEFCHEGTLRPLFLLGILPLILAIPVISFVRYVPRLRLMLRLGRIRYSNTHEVHIRCKKARFLHRPGSAKGMWLITWIALIDEQGETYYYAFPKGSEPFHSETILPMSSVKKTDPAKLLKEHFEGNSLTLLCYRNTNFIKSLDLPKGVNYV